MSDSRAHLRTVLFVEPTHVRVGGVGTFEARLAAELPRRGWRPVFALTKGRRVHSPERFLANLPALEWVEVDGTSGIPDDRRRALHRALREIAPDVVLPGAVHDAWAVLGECKARGRAPRLVYGLHGVSLEAAAFLRTYSAVVDAAFGVSPLTVTVLTGFCGLDPARVGLIASGVEPCRQPSSPALAGPVKLLYVGRFDPDKRVLDALALARELERRGVEFELTLVGSGVHADEVTTAARNSSGRIRVLPPQPLSTLYERIYPLADAVLIFSPIEGLANALLEGMAHGLVAITANFLGREALGLYRDGDTALVFPVGDMAMAADCVTALVRRPDLKAQIGAAGRRLVEAERTPTRMADDFVQVLDAALRGEALVGPVPPCPIQGQSRLRSVLGPRAAGLVRRLLRRSYEHADGNEWPLIETLGVLEPREAETRLRQVLRDFSDAPHDRRIPCSASDATG